MYRLVLSLCLFGVSGCGLILDFDPWPAEDTPDGSLDSGRAELDAAYADAGVGDGSLLVDANLLDGSNDSGRVRDAYVDSGHDDADASSDGSIGPDGGPPRRCEDTTEGICIRLDGVALIADWAAQFHWTLPAGTLHTIDWVAGRMDCIGGIRVIDADTTECEIAIPEPGTPVLDTGLAYIYPEHVDGTSPCIMSACPAYHTGWRLWVRGVEYPTDPATPGGRCGLENRTCLDGEHGAMRINLP